jgi:hypothetical protein
MSCFHTSLRRRKCRKSYTSINGLCRRDLARRLSFVSALVFGGGWCLFREWTADLAQAHCCYDGELDRQAQAKHRRRSVR